MTIVLKFKEPSINIGYYKTGEIARISVGEGAPLDRNWWRVYDESGRLKEEGMAGLFEKEMRKIYGEDGSVSAGTIPGRHTRTWGDYDWEKAQAEYDKIQSEIKYIKPVIQGISVTQSENPELFAMNRRNAAIVRSFENWLNGPRHQVVKALESTKGKAARRALVEAYHNRTR